MPLNHIPLIPSQINVSQFSFLYRFAGQTSNMPKDSRSLAILILFSIGALLWMPIDPICALAEILQMTQMKTMC